MGFLKSLGKGAGQFVGGVTGGIIKGVGELTNSDFIKEVGDGVKTSTEFAGKQLGNLAEGAWNVGSGMIGSDESKIDKGFSDIGEGVTSTAKAVGRGISSTVKNVGEVAGGMMEGDEERWKKGLRDVGKTVAVSALGVSVLEMTDVVDVNGDESTSLASDHNGSHHVDAHWVDGYERADGTYVEGYWRDGDGDTSVNQNSGWTQSNPGTAASQTIENSGSHHVDAHWINGYERADGTYVEGYWRDGDGDTSVNQNSGWTQSNPDYRKA
ncbi:hypothetical protein J9317_03570 [Metabacillus sp. KIGAM252]|uniref:Uncharacterized protein n=1 Tax=Metabacillus flavus TaxID=2823519 RepID=A0ABS5LB81_9BACI|nr:hypothetical protein [Metabacillus flavus]MBS2967853.1 hypothetical protein [Metabacillus flavus]